VSGSNGQSCPECAAPRRPDGTPSCGCTLRASDALRDARTAQAAAAEDFDPLRIRPYVDLPVTMTGTETPPAPGQAPQDAAPDETVRLPAVPEETQERHAPASDGGQGRHAVAPAQTGRHAVTPDGAPRRRRRAVLLAAGAVVAVVASVAFASGLFSYDPPQRDGALPENIRESVPEEPTSGEPSAATTATTAPASATASPSASPTPSVTPTSAPPSPATPSASSTSASPTPTRPASPTATLDRDQNVQALRPGDRGSEVTGLQLRLGQLDLYNGPANGNYNWRVERSVRRYQAARGITQDEPGVYGAATRAQLESETSAP